MARFCAFLPRLFLPVLVMAAVLGLSRAVAFEATSYGAWTGIILVLLAVLALLRPSRWLWLSTRRWAALALGVGLILATVALVWPVTVTQNAQSRTRLDRFLPRFQAREYHEVRTRAPVTRVLEAIRQVSLSDMPVASLLIRLRSLAPTPIQSRISERTPLLELMTASDFFLPLDVAEDRDQVFGMVGKPWESGPPPAVRSADDFVSFQVAGSVRIAFDFRLREEADGWIRLSTETRVLGTDVSAQRRFQRYWRMIYPGSAIIRRIWLDAIVARAERPL